jgi:hypothetical protein
MRRRSFLAALASLAACAAPEDPPEKTFFRVERHGPHWFFTSPEGEPVFSIGLNHIDSATLRFPSSGDVWLKRFANSERRFIEEGVRTDLIHWGFNCVGWNQEVVIRGETLTEGGILHRHSRSWTHQEYNWLDLPYCHLLPFIESHQWELESKLPDIRSAEFAEWCDYVARTDCASMAGDDKLVGYFYSDCPIWIHSRRRDEKPPIFDPAMLDTEAGQRELFDLATHYYRTIHDAVRRYDPNHLILGDRYEGRQPLAEPVLRAAVPYIDVLSFQNFGPIAEVAESFRHWHEVTGLPILLADANARMTDDPGHRETYSDKIKALRELDFCVGWHLCGAYLRNTARRRGIRNERFEPDDAFVAEITAANEETAEYVRTLSA